VLPSRGMRSRRTPRREVERHIADLARAYGWRHHRARCPGLTAEGYADGFPLDVLLRDGRLLFVAIRGATLSRPQTAWLEELVSVTAIDVLVVDTADPAPLARALASGRQAQPVAAAAMRRPAQSPRAPPVTVNA
jgi:hypothetical protein